MPSSKKAPLVLVFVVMLVLSGQLSVVQAQIGVDVRFNAESLTTVVNQPIEFTVTASRGTPPYSYQWCTQLWTTWKPGMANTLPPIGPIVEVPGATSSSFEFIESSPGTYDISIRIWDSAGNYVYDVFMPGGIWVFVFASLPPTPTPATPPTATPTATASPSPAPKTGSSTDMYIIAATAAVVAIIAVAAAFTLRKRGNKERQIP